MAYWYGYVYGDPLDGNSYRLLADYEDFIRPPCWGGCRICAILLDVPTPAPFIPPPLAGLILEWIPLALADGNPQPSPNNPHVLLRC